MTRPGKRLVTPLVILAFLSVVGGLIELPRTLGGLPLFSDFLGTVLPAPNSVHAGVGSELTLQIIAAAASLGGVYIAYLTFLRRPQQVERLTRAPLGAALHRLWFVGWGFDWLDNEIFAQPFLWLARKDKDDVIDRFYDGIAQLSSALHQALSRTQTGQIRRYAAGIVVGGMVVIAMVVLI